MSHRKLVNCTVFNLFEKIAQSHYRKALIRIDYEQKKRDRIAQFEPLIIFKKKLVLKYSGQARAGLLLLWEKERERRYRDKTLPV